MRIVTLDDLEQALTDLIKRSSELKTFDEVKAGQLLWTLRKCKSTLSGNFAWADEGLATLHARLREDCLVQEQALMRLQATSAVEAREQVVTRAVFLRHDAFLLRDGLRLMKVADRAESDDTT